MTDPRAAGFCPLGAATLCFAASCARLPAHRWACPHRVCPTGAGCTTTTEHFMTSQIKQPPKAVGLYDPRFEHDACGVGMVARLDNQPTHEVLTKAITALENLEHRGASGADPCTGDGAGILMQMPDELLRGVVDFELPPAGGYGVLMCFLPADAQARGRLEGLLERTVIAEGQRVLGWRDVPIDEAQTGQVAAGCRPAIRQLFVGAGGAGEHDRDAFERKLYVIRRVCELTAGEPGLYVASSSSRDRKSTRLN